MSFTQFEPKPLRTREQVAREVHAVSLARGLDELATAIALMTIAVEAGADDKDGQPQWWCPANRADSETLYFEHDSESNDSLSSGYLQQQPPWWGTVEQRMTLAQSADLFLSRLSDDYRTAENDPELAGRFAQQVQRSSFPDRYVEKWDEAWDVLRRALSDQPIKEIPMSWTGDPSWLEDVLRAELGDKLKALPDWHESGHGDFGTIWGVMVHHTGNANATAQSIRDGRPDLEGPVSNIHIAQDGTVTVVAGGVCWHSGEGSYPGIPTNNGNRVLIGIECAWPRDTSITPATQGRERWPDAEIISMRDTVAAILTKLGVDSSRVIGHKEYAGAAQGKWDPGNVDMNWFRGEVGKAMRGEFKKPITPVDPPAPPAGLSDRQLLEDIWKHVVKGTV